MNLIFPGLQRFSKVLVSAAIIVAFGGCNLYYDADVVDPPPDDAGHNACEPEDPDDLLAECDDQNAECGELTVTDRCGNEVIVPCGSCADGEECTNNICACAPESNAELCQSLDPPYCGVVTIEDRCGEDRQLNCGTCPDELFCGADNICQSCEVDCTGKCGMVPDGCGDFVDCSSDPAGEECDGDGDETCQDTECQSGECPFDVECEPDECGQISDRCGGVLTCGLQCEDDEDCVVNQCICQPEEDSELCSAQGLGCGSLILTDRCGNERTVDCGGCTSPEVCEENECVNPDCVGRDFDTDFHNCGQCGTVCGVDEICVEGQCQSFGCEADQGISEQSTCTPFGVDDCTGDSFCAFSPVPSPRFTCLGQDFAGDRGEGQSCDNDNRCAEGLSCFGLCYRGCIREGHQGCGDNQFCTDLTVENEGEDHLEEFGFCATRCSPQNHDACPAGRRCTADPAYPEGTCQPNFRCMFNGGSSGKSEGSSCDRKNLDSDGCPSGTRCFPADGAEDICVRLCSSDDDCVSGNCQNAASPWQALRYCTID